MALWKPSLTRRNVLPDLGARKCPMQAQHLGAETCQHPDLDMQQEVMRGMAIAPGPALGPAVDPASGPGTVMSEPDMTGHGIGPDMMKDHGDVMTDPVVMPVPVVMPPVPWPGPDMMTDHGTVISAAPHDRHDAVTETGRWAFPLPWDVFQKKVLSLLVDIRHRLKETQPASSAVHIERIDTMEDFELQEQRLSDAQAFDTLVLQISRIGGRNTKDCVHKVLDRVFTNSLMAKFNLKGKGKRGKRPLEGTKVYRAIQDRIIAQPYWTQKWITSDCGDPLTEE
uniref:uncharacterized protein LOC117260501 n=1 Tax=Epinephelus lanceolatus TaxID=310571 RepID=UPI001445793C|nr:uncharacterized protein LOC117260501 [Epinephelus lanceolatus]